MSFIIADTFTDSLARLTGEEQKAVKTTAFDLQLNPANPGMHFHKLDRGRDKDFWSVRVGLDLRLIVHKTSDSVLLCYVDHHDKAYEWAERRKLETHPRTGAAQLVEIRERIEEIVVPKYVEVEHPAPSKPLLFEHLSDDQLLTFGVPEEWINDVRHADEDSILDLAGHLPAEASEILLQLATGGTPPVPPTIPTVTDPFQHPDALRRFRLMNNVEELARALDYPWEKWTVFLHPTQRQWVESDFNGPACVSGSAGTGKTIVALHRAVHLARLHPDARVLLTTFSEPLANSLRIKLRRLIVNEPRLAERLEVHSMDAIGQRLHEAQFGKIKLIQPDALRGMIDSASGDVAGHRFSAQFLLTEWEQVVDAWQLDHWEAYRDVRRLGRKTRLPEAQRFVLWSIFEKVRASLKEHGLTTRAAMFNALAHRLAENERKPFDFAVIDEAQDIGVPQLRFLAALGGDRRNALFFAGDLGQRIFQQAFSWKSLNVDIRGRARTLRVNYRTSHQIRIQADRLLGQDLADVDGNTESRRGTVSAFNGPTPVVITAESFEQESDSVARWLQELVSSGVQAHEIGIFVRTEKELDRARSAISRAGLASEALDQHFKTVHGHVSLGTMHLAKGLEFRAVVVMACDDEIIPSQERIASVADEADLEEVYSTERHLLYVACTRARDHLLVSSGNHPSEFLDDLLA